MFPVCPCETYIGIILNCLVAWSDGSPNSLKACPLLA